MFSLRAPGQAEVERALAAMASASPTYPDVGATRGRMPDGWDHSEIGGPVGRGPADAERAIAALRAWEMFDLGWVRRHRADVPQVPGAQTGVH